MQTQFKQIAFSTQLHVIGLLRFLVVWSLCAPFWSCGAEKAKSALPAVEVRPSVAAGSYSSTQSVGFIVSATKTEPDLEIDPVTKIDVFYTTDGSEPTDASNVIHLDVSKKLTSDKVVAFASDDTVSVPSTLGLTYFAQVTCEHHESKKGGVAAKQEVASVLINSEVTRSSYVISSSSTASTSTSSSTTSTSSSTSTGTSGALTYTVTKPSTLPGNISFTTNAATTTCSSDGGSTYSDCAAAGTLAVTAAGYDAGSQYRVKFTKDSSTYEYTWTPKTEAPGLTMSSCNIGVVESLSKSAFEALWQNGTDATHRFTVCLADDVVVNANPTASVTVSATNVELVGSNTTNHRSTVHRLAITGSGSTNKAYVTGGTYQGGIVAQGTITKVFSGFWARGNDRNGVYIGGATMNLTLSNCDIDMTNSLGATESIYGDDTSTSLVLAIDSCTIKNTGTGSFGNDGMYFRGFGSTLTISNSTIQILTNNYSAAFRLHQSITATLTDTTVKADENAYQAININVTNTLTLTRVTVETGQRGLKFATSGNTLNLGNTTFKQTGGVDRSALDLSASSTQTINNTSSGGNNLFCYVTGSATSFLSILSSAQSSGTFTAAGTTNGNNTTINACP